MKDLYSRNGVGIEDFVGKRTPAPKLQICARVLRADMIKELLVPKGTVISAGLAEAAKLARVPIRTYRETRVALEEILREVRM